MKLSLSLALLPAVAIGCATVETSDDGIRPANTPLWASHRSGAMHVQVRRTLTAAPRTVGEDYERGRAEIDASHGRIFIGTSDHGFYALRASDLSTIWRFETLGVVQSEPLYDPDLDYVYFGSHDGALYCVRALDGAIVWRFASGAEVTRKPVRDGVHGERLFFANGADNLFAVDRRTGKPIWAAHRTPALGMEIAGHAGPAYENGTVYIAYSDGNFIAYRASDGAEQWPQAVDLAAEAEHQSMGEAQRYLDVDTTPVFDTNQGSRVVYVASYAGGVYARDAASGGHVWKNEKVVGVTDLMLWDEPAHPGNPDGPDRDTVAPARKYLLASSATTGLWALDVTQSGRDVWRVPVPEGGVTAPVAVAGALVVGTTRYGLFLISPLNGRVIDGFDLGTGFAQTPAAFGNRAYAHSNAGTLVSIQVEAPVVRTATEANPRRASESTSFGE